MAGRSSPNNISTKLRRIATLANQMPEAALTTLAHHIDVEWLNEAYRQTRKDGAAGIDGVTAEEYAKHLPVRLEALLNRAKLGDLYRAPPVRRVYIPKDGGGQRPLGIPTFEDKLLQRAVKMVMEAVYEQDFLDCSYGFRPGRSQHQALQAVRNHAMEMNGGWLLDLDIKSFFDSVDHQKLREIISQRVRDGVIQRLIGKWLKAGVMEEGAVYYPENGTPQGGVISPLLANIYLHEVVDVWFDTQVKPRMAGRTELVRFADDMLILCENERDARRVMEVLPKRLQRYNLELNPDKTRLVSFIRPRRGRKPERSERPGTFDFLGFTHYWARSRRGNWVVKQKTQRSRLTRSLRRIAEYCRKHRHDPVKEQRDALASKLMGHYGYYGITGNFSSLASFYCEVTRIWHKWLSRRSHKAYIYWKKMNEILAHWQLPPPRIVHSYIKA
jgi:group II intron reverse transcriptase/maturase